MNRKGQAPLLLPRVLVVALCLVIFAAGLLIISTAALAQDNNTDYQQPDITIVNRTIMPANTTTVKANVTVIPLNNNTTIR